MLDSLKNIKRRLKGRIRCAIWLTLNEGARTGTPEKVRFKLEELAGACSGAGGEQSLLDGAWHPWATLRWERPKGTACLRPGAW